MCMRTRLKKGKPSFLDKYKGRWVAVTTNEEVIASGKTLQDILPHIKAGRKPEAYALFVPLKKGKVQL